MYFKARNASKFRNNVADPKIKCNKSRINKVLSDLIKNPTYRNQNDFTFILTILIIQKRNQL